MLERLQYGNPSDEEMVNRAVKHGTIVNISMSDEEMEVNVAEMIKRMRANDAEYLDEIERICKIRWSNLTLKDMRKLVVDIREEDVKGEYTYLDFRSSKKDLLVDIKDLYDDVPRRTLKDIARKAFVINDKKIGLFEWDDIDEWCAENIPVNMT